MAKYVLYCGKDKTQGRCCKLKGMLKYLKGYGAQSLIAPLFKMLEALFDLFVPLVMADIINVGIGSGDARYIWTRCALLVLLGVIGLACSLTAQYFASRAAVGYAKGLRHALLERVQSLSFAQLDKIGSSTLITRMTSDINQVQSGLNLFLRLFMRSPFVVIGGMIMAFTVNARAAMIFVVAIPLLAVVVFGIMLWTMPMYKRVQARLDRVTGLTRENLSGVRVVRAFNMESGEVSRFEEANRLLAALQLRVGRISALMNPLTFVIVNVAIIAILNSGAAQINAGTMLSGDVIALVSYMTQILVELVKLANLIIQVTKALACAGRVKAVLDAEPDMSFPDAPASLDEGAPAVSFEHVSLKYPGAGADSISDISFSAGRGQTIGIIGGTGSGKSSLVSLIPRFYDATSGRVKLFGRDIAQLTREQVRGAVGMVMQKAQLFEGTIRSNLAWGNPGATDEELWSALEAAQADEFVRQRNGGLDSAIEQGGRNLSGGQRQRLTIARALVRRPEILILDDSASALDFATDAALRRALKALPWNVTTFIVSQRASSMMHADSILVMDDGALVGAGTHAELLKGCPVYREIYESQFKKEGEQ